MIFTNKILLLATLLFFSGSLVASEDKKSNSKTVTTPTTSPSSSPKFVSITSTIGDQSPITVEFEGETVLDLKRAMSPILGSQLGTEVATEDLAICHIPKAVTGTAVGTLKKLGVKPQCRCLKLAGDTTPLKNLNSSTITVFASSELMKKLQSSTKK